MWAMDITYIPMARGFVYLAAVMDWHSRKVLAWRVSVTMDTDFCVEALEESLGRHGAPEIFNTDQGSQFTSDAFTGLLKASEIQISMDGKGSWKDNVFVERLWKSVKYEEVYLRAYESVPEARTGLGRYFEFYNAGRPHSSLGGMTPDQFFDRAPSLALTRLVRSPVINCGTFTPGSANPKLIPSLRGIGWPAILATSPTIGSRILM